MPLTELSHRFERVELLPHDEQVRVMKAEIERLNKWNLRLQRALEHYIHHGDKARAKVLECLKTDGVI
jgi:hypothetical protein